MSEGVLRIDRLRVAYGDVLALRGMSLTLRPGQICGFVGPNGSGKTTALRAIAGARRPDGGFIRFDGGDPYTEPACRARIGFLTDRIVVHPALSPAAYLQHFAHAYQLDGGTAAARVREALDRTDLTRLAPGNCSTLSRGMHQRLALARLLVHRPDLLLLDEPAIGLDPLGRKLLWEVLHELADEGRTVLISSHVLNDLQRLCTHAMILRQGRVVRSGSLAELTAAAEQAADTRGYRIRLRWRQDHPAMPGLLEARPEVADLRKTHLTADFTFRGNAAALDGLLRELLERGVSVAEWRPHDEPLEDVVVAEYAGPAEWLDRSERSGRSAEGAGGEGGGG